MPQSCSDDVERVQSGFCLKKLNYCTVIIEHLHTPIRRNIGYIHVISLPGAGPRLALPPALWDTLSIGQRASLHPGCVSLGSMGQAGWSRLKTKWKPCASTLGHKQVPTAEPCSQGSRSNVRADPPSPPLTLCLRACRQQSSPQLHLIFSHCGHKAFCASDQLPVQRQWSSKTSAPLEERKTSVTDLCFSCS